MPSDLFFRSMCDELIAIDKTAADDYLTDSERKKIKKKEEGKDLFGRVTAVGGGMTMASGTLPTVMKGAFSPAPLLYHGTTLESANKILNSPVEGKSGILTRFAGKAGRLNEKMLSEAVARAIDDAGITLTDDEIIRFVLGTKRRLSEASAMATVRPEILAGRFARTRHDAVQQAAQRARYRAKMRLMEIEPRLPDSVIKMTKFHGDNDYYLDVDYRLKRANVPLFKSLEPAEKKLLLEYVRHISDEVDTDWRRRGELLQQIPRRLKDHKGHWLDQGLEVVAKIVVEDPNVDLDLLETASKLAKKQGLNYWDMKAKGSDDEFIKRWTPRLRDSPPYDSVKIVRESMSEVLAQKGVKAEEAQMILSKLDGTLRHSGKRVYFGWTPSAVAAWGEKGSEAVMLARKTARSILADKDFEAALKEITEDLSKAAGKPVKPFPAKKFTNVDDLDEALSILTSWLSENSEALSKLDQKTAERVLARATQSFNQAGSKFAAKQGIIAAGDILTMGIIPETREIGRILSYRPQRTRKMTLAEASKYVAMLEGEGAKKSVVIGARVPAGSMRWLTDFPGLGPLMAANPGLKHAVSRFIPNFDPSRDISIPDDVLTPQFRSLDIVDMDSGKFERIKITDGKMPSIKVSRYLKGLTVLAPIAIIGTLGLDLMQSGVRGTNTYTHKLLSGDLQLLPSKKNPKVRRWQDPRRYFQKAASARAARKAALSVAKFTVPPVLIGTAAGVGAEAAISKASPLKDLPKNEPARTGAVATRSIMMNMPASVLGLTAGAILRPRDAKVVLKGFKKLRAATKSGDFVDPPKGFGKSLARLYAAGVLGATAATSMASGTDATKRGLPAHLQSPVNTPLASKKGRELTKKYPQVSMAAPLAATALAAPTIAYAARRFYPGHSLAAVKMVTDRGGFLDLQEKWLQDAAKWMRKKRYPASPGIQRDLAMNQGMKAMNKYFDKLEKAT